MNDQSKHVITDNKFVELLTPIFKFFFCFVVMMGDSGIYGQSKYCSELAHSFNKWIILMKHPLAMYSLVEFN